VKGDKKNMIKRFTKKKIKKIEKKGGGEGKV